MASPLAHCWTLPRASIARSLASRARARSRSYADFAAATETPVVLEVESEAAALAAAGAAASAATPQPTRTRLSASTQLHIPAPRSLVQDGVTRLFVAVATGVPGLLHSLAVVRAIEQKFGPVVDIVQGRVGATGAYKSHLFVDLLHPLPRHVFDTDSGELILEVPLQRSPSFAPTSGGPSLDEVTQTLTSTSLSAGAGSGSGSGTSAVTNHATHEMMLLALSPAAPRPTRARPVRLPAPLTQIQWQRQGGSRNGAGAGERAVDTHARRAEEDEAIARALAGFGGFAGGFEPLQRTYRAWAEREQEREAVRATARAEERGEATAVSFVGNDEADLARTGEARQAVDTETAKTSSPIAAAAPAAVIPSAGAQPALEKSSIPTTRRIWNLFGPAIPDEGAVGAKPAVDSESTRPTTATPPSQAPATAAPSPAPSATPAPPPQRAPASRPAPLDLSSTSATRAVLPPGKTGIQRREWFRERAGGAAARAGARGRGRGRGEARTPGAEQGGQGLLGALGNLKHWATGRNES